MNIHFINGERVDTNRFRKLTQLKLDRTGTEQPRTREGIGEVPLGANTPTGNRITESSVYPGGKILRRRMAKLKQRQDSFARDYKPGVSGKAVNGEGYMTKPGSMR